MELLFATATGLLFAIGIFLILRRNMIRSVIGLFVLSNAVNLFLLATGAYQGKFAAYAGVAGQISDPLPQALILTAIVISLGGFAFILAMIYILSLRQHSSDMDEIARLRN